MYLDKLSLLHYKNFEQQDFYLNKKINCFVGPNGIGKTNVLDSIYHLAYGKSYFNPITSQNINHYADFFVIEGHFVKHNRDEKIVVSAKKGQKKIIKRNGKAYEKFSEHIGLIPLVIISPADRDLIIEGSEMRRKFIDSIISQSDTVYLQNLIRYNKTLSQRNSLLKFFAANRSFNQTNLEVYNEQLEEFGKVIFEKRKAFLEIFAPIFEQRYESISNKQEKVAINYKSQLSQLSLNELFKENLDKDRALQYTSVGTHKDDLVFKLNNHPIKKYGSQGQQKSFLIALKLAQYDFLKKQNNVNPILLLDDIFDKLDEQRVRHIIQLVSQDDLGQLFISDTHPDRTEAAIKASAKEYSLINLQA